MTERESLLRQPLDNLKGVGPATRSTLAALGLETIENLLMHLPSRYEDRTQLTPLSQLEPGTPALFVGEIVDTQIAYGRRRSLLVNIRDPQGAIAVRFYHFSSRQRAAFVAGRYLQGYGTPRFVGRRLEIAHPEYSVTGLPADNVANELTPVYPTTKGVGQNLWRKLLAQACALLNEDNQTDQQIRFLHQPPADATQEQIEQCRDALALEELTAYYLVMKHRARERLEHQARSLPRGPQWGRQLLDHLGFQLTGAQRRVVTDILTDLEARVPMLRLLQGDVGSGKTVVAAFAAIRAAEHNLQTAVMAPTEILAEQHYLNFRQWFEPLNINVVLLTGGQKKSERTPILADISSGKAQLVVGTHALFQREVQFADLALVIIDEQHRFGVHQRMALRGKGYEPHQLIMTATPIPRTLTMALYADMDLSVIDELPAGRQPITTTVVAPAQREQIISWLEHGLGQSQQAYWVCTLIEPSEESNAASATEVVEELTSRLSGYRVALLHGQMKSDDKARIMREFKDGFVDLLVATTVIEVGVDVPNVTMMVIENPERLGLAQLHQLRGRVGRGQAASHCVLLRGESLSQNGRARLKVMRDSQDGFLIAEKDLELRGPGEILGSRQTGEQDFKVADLHRHQHLIPDAVKQGEALLTGEAGKAAELLRRWTPGDATTLAV